VNQNEREGKSMGRTTGASGQDAEQQQNRTIENQESEPGKVWQESDQTAQGSYSGQGGAGGAGTDVGGGTGGKSSGGTPQGSYQDKSGTNVGGSDPGAGGGTSGQSGMGGAASGTHGNDPTGQGGLRGGFSDTRDDDAERVNEQMDESQWQGSRFSQGGSQGNNPGGSNG
jgi:hypothetical protein